MNGEGKEEKDGRGEARGSDGPEEGRGQRKPEWRGQDKAIIGQDKTHNALSCLPYLSIALSCLLVFFSRLAFVCPASCLVSSFLVLSLSCLVSLVLMIVLF